MKKESVWLLIAAMAVLAGCSNEADCMAKVERWKMSKIYEADSNYQIDIADLNLLKPPDERRVEVETLAINRKISILDTEQSYAVQTKACAKSPDSF